MSESLIPEDAPFTAEQRAWLNGFFAGWIGAANPREAAPAAAEALLRSPEMNGGRQKTAPAKVAAPAVAVAAAASGGPSGPGPAGVSAGLQEPEVVQLEGDYPWHDESLDLDERMKLAEGQTPTHKLMAAMAQLDCGACGYMCDTYAMAIASGEEPDLSLCSPGGVETARMLKKIAKGGLSETAPAGGSPPAPATDAPAAPTKQAPAAAKTAKAAPAASEGPAPIGRSNPFRAKILKLQNLNGPGSQKHTVHAEISLPIEKLSYRVGDSLGVYPTNCPDLVEEILLALRAHGTEHVVATHGIEATLRDALTSTANLKDVPDRLVHLVAESTDDTEVKQRLEALLEDLDQLDTLDVLDLLKMAPRATVDVKAFSQALRKLQPRLYSIASSPKAHPNEVHLTIAKVAYELNGRGRKGVASTMFSDRLDRGDTILVYVHGAPGFTVPDDPTAPMIMVGPGTGIAPFRAFLEEREATAAAGKNWLFFGDQHEATDFLYRDDLERMQKSGALTKLSTAFSRDQDEKLYVQHRMQQAGAELFAWLEEGAYFFVCGDAKRMAVDVHRTLHQVVAEHGKMSDNDAKAYVKALRDAKRYVRDVY